MFASVILDNAWIESHALYTAMYNGLVVALLSSIPVRVLNLPLSLKSSTRIISFNKFGGLLFSELK